MVMASGVSVPAPDFFGKPLCQTLMMLRAAGLGHEPEIIFAPSKEQPSNHVLEVTPDMRRYVTPHASVVCKGK